MITLAQTVDFSSIAKIIEIALLVAFIAIIVFFVLAIIIGLFRGLFASVFRTLVMFALVLVAILTLDSLVKGIAGIDLSFISKYIVITNGSGQSITVAVSNLFSTLSDTIGAAMYLNGYQADLITISQLAVSLTTMILKFLVLFIDMILIITLGNIFATLLWHIGFKRLIPKFVRKMIKIRWLSAILDGLRYVVVLFLLIAPLSSIINSVNQTWQKYKPDSTNNPTVQSIGTFLDTYNNSLLAQTLFNWTYSSETGLTFDAQLISSLTSSTFNDTEMSLIDLLNSLGSVGGAAMVLFENTNTFNLASLLTTESLEQLFSSLNNFALLPYLLPLGFTIALNANLIEGLDTSVLELDNIDWKNELATLETIIIDINNTGIVSKFVDENGNIASSVNASDILDAMFAPEAYDYTIRVFDSIDNSELLSQVVPLVMSYVANISPDVGEFLPSSYQECKAIKWGFELSVVYDNLYRLNRVDPALLEYFIDLAAPSSPQSLMSTAEEASNGGIDPKLLDFIVNNIDTFKSIFVGQFDRNGNLLNCNEEGYSISSNRSGYALFDLNILKGAFRPLTEMIVDGIAQAASEDYSEIFEDAFDQLFEGHVVRNFKVEFGAIFDCLKDISKNDTLMDAIVNGQFDNLLKVGRQEARELATIVERLDRSKIITSVLKPVLAEAIKSPDLKETFNTIGLEADDFKIMECDDICHELAHIIKAMPAITNITELVDSPNVMTVIGDYTEDIAFVLDTVFVSEILNPDFDPNKDNNFYRVLDFVFKLTKDNGVNGLTFKRDEVNAELGYQKWNNTLTPEGDYPRDAKGNPMYDGEIGDLIYTLDALCFENVTIGSPYRGMTLFECFSDSSVDMGNLVSRLEKEFHISKVFACVDKCALIKPTFGDFLDGQLVNIAELGLIDLEVGRTFNNVEDWTVEGEKFGQMCNIIGDIDVDLANLDILAFDDFDGLNKLLHSIADLTLFIDPTDRINGTTFNDFLFDKIKTALVTDDLDLLSDETSTDTEKTFIKAKFDFQVENPDGTPIVAQKEDWCSSAWMDEFMDNNEVHSLDSSFYEGDLISEACRVIKSLDEMKKSTEEATGETYDNYIQALTSAKAPAEDLDVTLSYINAYGPLRMVVYHTFDLIFSTVSTGGFIDFSNLNTKYLALDSTGVGGRQDEIDNLMSIYSFYLDNFSDSTNFDFMEFIQEPSNLVYIHNMVSGFVESHVFHLAGPNDGVGLTCFQSLMEYILKVDGLKDMLYSEDPLSKDQSSLYSSLYYDVNSKIYYMVDVEHFDYEMGINEQRSKIDGLFEVISSFMAGPIDIHLASVDDDFTIPGSCYEGLIEEGGNFDFSNIDIATVSTSAMNDVLTNLNDSDLLYEIVPNALNKLFKDNSNPLLNDLVLNSDPFYAYYLVDEHNPNYDARYSQDEIDNLCELIDHFEEINVYLGDGDVAKVLELENAEFDIFMNELENMFGNLYKSYVFHQYNNIKLIDEFSSFESFVKKIFIETSLYTLIYNEEIDAPMFNPSGTLSSNEAAELKLESNIRKVSEQDYNFKYVTGSLNTVGLSDVWFDDDDVTNDEIKSFGNFMRAIKALNITDLGSFTIDLENTETFNPENIGSVFLTLNRVDVAEGAVGHLMKQLMNESGLSNYSSYNGVDYAAYFLTQREFDSPGGLEHTIQFLRDVAVYDEDGNFESYNVLNKNADDPLYQYIENGKSTTHILEFITHSLMYTHNEVMLDNGERVLDDAILFYNLFTPNNSNVKNVSDYIYGDTKDTKICTLNHLIHHFDYHPEYDGNAIDVLIMANFNDTNFDAGDFESVRLIRESIYRGLVALTRDDGDINNPDRGRAFIASEIFAGIIDEFVISEINLNNASLSPSDDFYLDYNYFLTRKDASNQPISSYHDIDENSYDLLNVDEARGINAVLAMYSGNTLEDYFTISEDDMRSYFADMEYEYTRDDTNSRFASLVYISRIRTIFDAGFAAASWFGFTQNYEITNSLDLLDYNVGFINFGEDVIGAISTLISIGS